MSRKVKCFITGEEGTSDTFVKIGSHYYKSQAVYDQYRHEIDTRNAIVTRIANEFLGYQTGQKFPAYIQKKLNELNYYSYDVILKTIDKMSDKIMYYMNNKEFKNESGKISYIFAIISNNINDVNKEYQWKRKNEEHEHHTEIVDIPEEIPTPSKVKDISSWLDGDDM